MKILGKSVFFCKNSLKISQNDFKKKGPRHHRIPHKNLSQNQSKNQFRQTNPTNALYVTLAGALWVYLRQICSVLVRIKRRVLSEMNTFSISSMKIDRTTPLTWFTIRAVTNLIPLPPRLKYLFLPCFMQHFFGGKTAHKLLKYQKLREKGIT